MKVTEQDYYMDGYLKTNLDVACKVAKKDWDFVFVIDGTEGGGKSVLAFQCAKFLDSSFCIERIVFNDEELVDAIIKAKPYQAIVFDEAYTGLSSRAAMSMINRTLIQMFAEIRQKNLFIFVVMPTFFDLDKYIALWRSRALIHVYTGKQFERGYFCFYNVDLKKQLYVYGKKFYNYSRPKPNFRGRFTNYYPIDEEAYRKKKLKSLKARESKRVLGEHKIDKFAIALKAMCEEWSQREVTRRLNKAGLQITQPRITQILKENSRKNLRFDFR